MPPTLAAPSERGVRSPVVLRLLASVLLACVLAGCTSARSPAPPAAATFTVAADGYAEAFEAAKRVLLDQRFELERVDARAGIILTRPRSGAGLLAPWTMGPGARPVEDTLNAQSRRVEVRFEPAEEIDRLPGGVPDALADPRPPVSPSEAQGAIVVSVRALISRRVTPTRRLDPTTIRGNATPADPTLFQRGLSAVYTAPHDLDAKASRSLSRAIQRRLDLTIAGAP